MKILAFDTSNQALSLALLEDDRLLAEFNLTIKKNHSISLMPSIDFVMTQVGWKPQDLDRIVVAQGPGSYTGLRVAVATAKTLAYSLDIDLVGVSSLQVLASSSGLEGTVIALMDARRNNAYVGFYANGRALESDKHASLEEILVQANSYPTPSFVGEVAAFKEQILTRFPDAQVKEILPSAAQLGRLGLALPAQDVHAFVPSYLKRVEAEENWLKSHQEDSRDYIKRV